MKKILYPLALFMALAAWGTSNAQSVKKGNAAEAVVETTTDKDIVVRQNIKRPITQLIVKGKSSVMLVYDTVNYVEAVYNPDEVDPLEEEMIVVKGFTLLVDDPDGTGYYVIHLKKKELQSVKNSSGNPIIYVELNDTASPQLEFGDSTTVGRESGKDTTYTLTTSNLARQQQVEEARQQLGEARQNLAKTLDRIPLEPIEVVVDDYDSSATSGNGSTTIISYGREYDSYSFEDRAGAAFLWGFNNWGDKWYNGLGKMDGVYELRTSFSSWQLEFTYAVIMTRHFYVDLGIGYESDIYKFTTPLVDIDNNGILVDRGSTYLHNDNNSKTGDNQALTNTTLDDWSSRLVTRYFSIPIDMVFRFDNDFKIGFSAIPALGFSSSHTGLKHEIDNRSLEYLDAENISKHITPYKLDLRLSMRFDHFGFFAQVSALSLFKEKDVYPIKIGFIIK